MGKAKVSFVAALVALSFCEIAHAAEVKVAPYGVTKDGRAVTAYTLLNDKGASATILDFGGAIAAVRVPDRNGKLGNVVMSFADMAGWEAIGHANSTLGRLAQRVRGGFTLDGVYYKMQVGANGVVNHSGPPSFATRMWNVEPIRKQDGAAVTLSLLSPDGDQGLPGEMKIKITYSFSNDNALRLDYVATTNKPTVVNLTNHIYFNLKDGGETPVFDHVLQMEADRYAVKDPDGVQMGPLQSVIGTPLDFVKPTAIRARMPLARDPAFASAATAPPVPEGMVRSYDNSLTLKDSAIGLDKVAVRLSEPVSGRVVEIKTTDPSLQFFTAATGRAGFLNDAGKPFSALGPAVAI